MVRATPVIVSRPRCPAALRLAALTALLGAAALANPDEARSTLGMSATVLAVARVELPGGEPDLLITAADLERGYVEIPDVLQVTIYSNSRSGYALDVLPRGSLIAGLAVRGLGADIRLPADGGTITQRWQRPQTVSLALRFRFELARDAQPGRYPWPFHFAARPLT